MLLVSLLFCVANVFGSAVSMHWFAAQRLNLNEIVTIILGYKPYLLRRWYMVLHITCVRVYPLTHATVVVEVRHVSAL